MDLKSFNFSNLQKLADPKAAGDLNAFLEKLPQNAGNAVLIAAGIAWATAAVLGIFTMVKYQQLIETRAELRSTEALEPLVPQVSDKPVPAGVVQQFAGDMAGLYRDYGLDIKARGPAIFITAKETDKFGAFREAIGHVQNGGSGWRVNMDRLCVGRACKGDKLAALLKINKVSVDK